MIILGAGAGGMQPSTPIIGTATAGDVSASVAFTPSTYIGKGTITYTATSSPGGFTGTSATSPITVTGLTNGTAYTFTVVGTTNYGVVSATTAASNSVTPENPIANGYSAVATATVTSGGTSSVIFSSIPSGYTHLELRYTARADTSGVVQDNINLEFNGDTTTSNYRTQRFYTEGTSIGRDEVANYNLGGRLTGASANANFFGNGTITIPDYASTTKKKAMVAFSGVNNGPGANGGCQLFGGTWSGTAAINQIKITATNGNLVQYSKFYLYGIK
jgi:hypothetical protein